MKKIIAVIPLVLGLVVVGQAGILKFDLSPPGTDHAVGLSPLNEAPPVTNSLGSGNEILSGITFDTDTLTLNLSLGYGSVFGFANLTGPATAAHIHGPAPTNTPAPILIDLAGIHIPGLDPTNGGSIIGSLVLTTNEASDLLAGLLYINVHTATNLAGEIRGQLILTNAAPTLVCPASTNLECTGDGTLIELNAQVSDADGDALTVVWSANGVPVQTNTVAAGSSTNATTVSLLGVFQVGTNVVTVSVSDGVRGAVTCTTTVTVVDTTPPTIVSVSATPNELWPPNHKMIPVQISVVATDLCGTATSKIIAIHSSQDVHAKGSGNTAPDFRITGDLRAQIRAERAGPDKNGRTYTITIESTDESGNSATADVIVFVPHDQGQHAGPPDNGNSGSNGNSGNNGNSGGNGNSNGNGHGKPPKNK